MKCFLELGLPLIFQYNCPCSGPHHLSLLCNKLPGGTLNFVSIIYSLLLCLVLFSTREEVQYNVVGEP